MYLEYTRINYSLLMCIKYSKHSTCGRLKFKINIMILSKIHFLLKCV